MPDILKKILIRTITGLLFALALLYLGDWAVWALRPHNMDTAVVNRVVVAPLKGNKEEYYADGSETVTCSVSLFPQAGAGACWWIRRNRTVFERGSHG